MEPVSYTHLDVYKRQLPYPPVICIYIFMISELQELLRSKAIHRYSFIAVSYTHLICIYKHMQVITQPYEIPLSVSSPVSKACLLYTSSVLSYHIIVSFLSLSDNFRNYFLHIKDVYKRQGFIFSSFYYDTFFQ